MGSYKLKSAISYGKADGQGGVTVKDYPAGASIDLSDAEAQEVRHALLEPPEMNYSPGTSAQDIEAGAAIELEDDEKEALESIRKRPDNRDSGVMLHWQTDPLARAAVERQGSVGTREAGASGFDRANVGSLNASRGLMTVDSRPEANKTEMERDEEETIKKAEEDVLKKAAKRADAAAARGSNPVERTVPAAPPAGRPVAPASPVRPAPASQTSSEKK